MRESADKQASEMQLLRSEINALRSAQAKCDHVLTNHISDYGIHSGRDNGPLKAPEDDSLGAYMVTKDDLAVLKAMSGFSRCTGVLLPKDAIVQVVQVENIPSEHRLRGRIEQPAGWITLQNTD